MFRRALLFVLFALFMQHFDQTKARAQDAGDIAFDTRLDPLFGDATTALGEFLHTQHFRSKQMQHFCIAGYRSADGSDKRAWIHWIEGRKIIRWRGSRNPQSATTSIARSRITDLRKDVVPTEAEIHGSTYLVTRAWVDHLIADCEAHGTKYQISLQAK